MAKTRKFSRFLIFFVAPPRNIIVGDPWKHCVSDENSNGRNTRKKQTGKPRLAFGIT